MDLCRPLALFDDLMLLGRFSVRATLRLRVEVMIAVDNPETLGALRRSESHLESERVRIRYNDLVFRSKFFN